MGWGERSLVEIDLPEELRWNKRSGKVREVFGINDSTLAIVATDRLSSFDWPVGEVPSRGQLLNLTSAHFFEKTRHVVPNHFIELPHQNVMIVKKCKPLPIEGVVR